MDRIRRRLASVMAEVLFLAAFLCGCALEQEQTNGYTCLEQNNHVLFISSYSYTWPTVPLQIAGIQSGLGASTVLDIEFMDTKVIQRELAQERLRERILIKQEAVGRYDAVIVGDDAALIFAMECREELFPGIPIVFEGINNIAYARQVSQEPLITGVIERFSYEENLDFARSIQPNANRVVAIVDNTVAGIGEQQQFFAQQEKYPELSFETINSSELTRQELMEQISNLGNDTILIYLILSEDLDGNLYTIEQSCYLLRDCAKVPVYRFVQAGIGEGVLGGKIVLHQTSGEIAARMVMQMLACQCAVCPAMQDESPNGFYLDAQVMKRFGISESLVPEDAVIINREQSFWELYGMAILISVGICAAVMIALGLILHAIQEKQTQERLRQKNREMSEAVLAAQNAMRAKSIFLHSISHDIRTPMNAIVGFTEIVKKLNTNKAVEPYLKKISDSSEHLLSLINDLLDISRLESGKMVYTPIPTNLCAITDSVLTMAQGFLAGRNLDFRVERSQEGGHCTVLTDPVRIREILINLLSNAVKFTEDGGTVVFSMGKLTGADEKHVTIFYQVSDTGCGMSEEFLPHVFEEFCQEQSDTKTRYKGTGLGMSITKRYVDMMGGKITVQSKQGQGTTFRVELPMEMAEQTEKCQQTMPVVRENLKGVRVLMAEDNDLNAEIVCFQLEDVGMEVTRAVDGQEAVQMFRQNPAGRFDAILMDIMMPNMDGHEAARTIRAMEDRPDGKTIPIIAMTANAFVEDVQAALDAGMNAHLAKPLSMDELLKTIARSIG